MCLLIYKPHNKKIPKSHYENAFKDNPDGGGVAYCKDEQLIIEKGFKTFDEMMKILDEVGELTCLIHFRKASKDMKVCKEQCHPFQIDIPDFTVDDKPDGKQRFTFAVGHNGRLSHRSTDTESDTHCFVMDILTPLLQDNPFFLDLEVARNIMQKIIQSDNKMVIFRYDAQENLLTPYILNQDGGWGLDKKAHWLDGVWYSNNSYLPPYAPVKYNYSKPHDGGVGGAAQQPLPGLSQTEADGIAQYVSSWSLPDSDGWYWNFQDDCWENKTTGMTRWTLHNRSLPNYMKKRTFLPVGPLPVKLKHGIIPPIPLSKGDMAEMGKDGRVDPDLLSDEDWQKWYGGVQERIREEAELEGGIRDNPDGGPIEEDDEKDLTLRHLNKEQKKMMRRAASDYAKHIFGPRTKSSRAYSNAEMIVWLRSDLRKSFDFMANFDPKELDKWVVTRLAAGMDIVDMIIRAELSKSKNASDMQII